MIPISLSLWRWGIALGGAALLAGSAVLIMLREPAWALLFFVAGLGVWLFALVTKSVDELVDAADESSQKDEDPET